MISPTTFKGLSGWVIENPVLRLVVLPDLGAKLASLVYKPQDFEVFFQPTLGTYTMPHPGADFSAYDTSGADEMYPTIDECQVRLTEGRMARLPDHGELWSQKWRVVENTEELVTEASGAALPYLFTRSVHLAGRAVCLEYAVQNQGEDPLPGLWAFHGLTACDNDSEIVLPGVNWVRNVHDSDVLGPAGGVHSFPFTDTRDGQQYRLNDIHPVSTGRTSKFYVNGPVPTGEAVVTLNHGKLKYELQFPPDEVPYLGVWVNEGGFKGEYNCALEPSTGYYDSPAIAESMRGLKLLGPGETRRWWMKIVLTSLA